jgi:molybdate-binding protein/DNA-binding XRE family transcriptional regulator
MAGSSIPNRVKERRLELGWSQAELAQRSSVSRSAVSAIEGRRLVPSVTAALALASAFGCAVEDVFGRTPDVPADSAAWAWPPAPEPCRFWHAAVRGRQLLYPVEPNAVGSAEHDGIYSGGTVRVRSRCAPQATLVMACCDPATGVLAAQLGRAAGVRLLVFLRSSQESLVLLSRGLIHVAGVHFATDSALDRNAQAVHEQVGTACFLLRLARWQEGLALAPHARVRTVQTALRAKLRWVGREPGSGARQCLDELLGRRHPPRRVARSHRSVAETILDGWADAGICLRLVSEEAGLQFLPLREEMFDLCYPADLAADPRVEALRRTVRSTDYRRLLGELPGYEASTTGEERRVL